MATTTTSEFGSILRHWREARRFSQLDLALQADVSSKHVSFLETGRTQPSREMIVRLCNAMDLPLRDRNVMLSAAGFASVYNESSLDSPAFQEVDGALQRILDVHEPYPAIVMDADWTIRRQNRGAVALTTRFIEDPATLSSNAFELLFSERGLQPYVEDWDALSSMLLMRLFREAVASSNESRKRALFDRIENMPAAPRDWRERANRLPSGPTVDLVLKKADLACRFFTTVTTFGTPQDITLQELRIESYFPADDATRLLCESWSEERVSRSPE